MPILTTQEADHKNPIGLASALVMGNNLSLQISYGSCLVTHSRLYFSATAMVSKVFNST
jgi:hypothetical protein